MSDLNPIKRFSVGNFAQVDVIGNMSEMVIGEIVKVDGPKIHVEPVDGSELIITVRDACYKVTPAEVKAAKSSEGAEESADEREARFEAAGMADDGEQDPDDDSEEEEGTLAVRLNPDLSRYTTGGDSGQEITHSGRKAVDINDLVAQRLRGLELNELYPIVAYLLQRMGIDTFGKGKNALPVTEQHLRDRYAHLNPGMQRMNLGNLVRNGMERLGLDTLPTIPNQ